MLEVKGYRILVKPDPLETVRESGIILVLDEKLERSGQQFGTVIGIGHTCWQSGSDNQEWCVVGDRILFSKHSGRFVYDPDTEEELMVMNDDDVLCRIVKENKDV